MKLFAASLLALMVLSCRTVSPPQPVETFGLGTSDLVEASNRLTQALSRRDEQLLESLLAPEYIFNYIDHEMRGSMQAMPNAPRGKWAIKMIEETRSMPLSSGVVDARVYGDIGVVVSHYRWTGHRDGGQFDYEGYVTDVWVRRSGTWLLLAGHASLFCPGYR